ncbi:MAG: AAA family ATPase [Planctomycetota bacterium]
MPRRFNPFRLWHQPRRRFNVPSPLRTQLLVYAHNLLRQPGELSPRTMAYVQSILPEADAKAIARLVKEPAGPDKEEAVESVSLMPRTRHPVIQTDDGEPVPADPAAAAHLRKFMTSLVRRRLAAGAPALASVCRRQLAELRGLFSLTREDTDLVLFLYCLNEEPDTGAITEELQPASARIAAVAAAVGIPAAAVRHAMGPNGRLTRCGILADDETDYPVASRESLLDPAIVDYLSGFADKTLVERFTRRNAGPVHPLESFTVARPAADAARRLLASGGPRAILLHGAAGTGKTEFARSLTRAAGRRAWFMQYGDKGAPSDRKLILNAALATTARRSDGLLIVDEADSFLARPITGPHEGVDKGWVNNFFDRSGARMIWIANSVEQVEESTLRRFDYSIEFRPFTGRERAVAWERLLKGHPLRKRISAAAVSRLAASYNVSVAGIAAALKSLPRVVGRRSGPALITAALRDLVERHAQLTGGGRVSGPDSAPDAADFDPTALNTAVPVADIAAAFSRFQAGRHRGAEPGLNMNLLFHGMPGTGKTALAGHLARTLSARK